MIILITGSRDWTNKKVIMRELTALLTDERHIFIHGNARGADKIGAECALELGMDVRAFSAEWDKYGLKAGPIRNRQMLDEKPDLVLAFHDDILSSKGTKDCYFEAKARGIKTYLFRTF